jgi:hypothetical protein
MEEGYYGCNLGPEESIYEIVIPPDAFLVDIVERTIRQDT